MRRRVGRHSRPRRGFGRTQEIPRVRERDAPSPASQGAAQEERDVARETPGRARAPRISEETAEPVRGGHPAPHEAGPASRGARVSPSRDAAPGPAGPVPTQRERGPRQEYLDAFDAQPGADTPPGGTNAMDDVFAAEAAGKASGKRAPATAVRGAADDQAEKTDGDSPGTARAADTEHAHDAEEPEVSRNDFAKGRRGRTVTGIAAAAITTVLTVLVAGQVATGEDDSRGSAAGDGERSDDAASRSEGRPNQTEPGDPSSSPAPLTYEEKMVGLFAMEPEMEGTGDFTAVTGGNKGSGSGEKIKYRVDVEKDLGLDGKLFARAVHTTLNDDRSWTNNGERDFERISSGDADFVITLASPGTTAEWCAKSGLDTTEDNVSCDSAATERIMINGFRWARGAKTFGDSRMLEYRQMLINHEVGHRLGFNHAGCEKDGALAPVMMQQTKDLMTDGRTCKPNAWVHPTA